eukprot:TRINITY_DN642_c5_g1_i1.p1 TRINITY_DN642_c5_g1~~TRINITY_DN642_c5_g1_i1.p1  ORF type:complete len:735 (-),score=339.68 TRINITY_DN642_c5_g1_i1:121-2325(-)
MNQLLQLINDDAVFDIEKFSKHLKSWKLDGKGLDYRVVGILGVQSSGKSTLLNLLFDSTFQEMDNSQGLSQTTVGIWTARAPTTETIILDVEGSDSKERGAKHENWERKMALFCLALSQVLIINVSAGDLGRYTGSGYGLLQAVLELNLQLFQGNKQGKTLLLFAIRDHSEKILPLNKLFGTIQKDIKKIWSEIKKPEQFLNSQPEEFFEIGYAALPHKWYQTEEFVSAVGNLRDRFENKSNQHYVFSPNFPPDVPISGLPLYAKNIWNTIINNKDLDIPSQKEIVASFRCSEIANELIEKAQQNLEQIESKVKEGYVKDFSELLCKIVDPALALFDDQTNHYVPSVVLKKRLELSNKIIIDLSKPIFRIQLTNINNIVSEDFKKEINDRVTKGTKIQDNLILDFTSFTDHLLEKTLKEFKKLASESIPSAAKDNWDFEIELNSLIDACKKKIIKLKKEQLTLLEKILQETINTNFKTFLNIACSDPKPDLWPTIRESKEKTLTKSCDELSDKIKGFDVTSEDEQQMKNQLNEYVNKLVDDVIEANLKDIDTKLVKRFDKLFKFTKEGVPMKWGASDKIDKKYQRAKEDALSIINLLVVIRLDKKLDDIKINSSDFSDFSLLKISYEQIQQIQQRFSGIAEASYKEALIEQERARASYNIYYIFAIIVIILGYNELMYLFYSPYMFFILGVILIGLYALYALGLLPFLKPIIASFAGLIFKQAGSAIVGKTKTD